MRVSERGKERRNFCRGRGIFYSKNVNKVSSYIKLCFKFKISDWTGGTYQDRRYMSEYSTLHNTCILFMCSFSFLLHLCTHLSQCSKEINVKLGKFKKHVSRVKLFTKIFCGWKILSETLYSWITNLLWVQRCLTYSVIGVLSI